MNESQRFIRIGPLSLFALIAMLFLSTLAVLSITTSSASYNLANLQADGMDQQYEAETAAQTFLALVGNQYSSATLSAQRDTTDRANAARSAQAARDAAQAAATTGTDASNTTGNGASNAAASGNDAATGGSGGTTSQDSGATGAQDASAQTNDQAAREIAELSARTAASSISGSINQLAQDAAASVDSRIAASAQINGPTITAQFACPNGRVLDIEVELESGGAFRIIQWNMTAKVNSAEPEMLWIGM